MIELINTIVRRTKHQINNQLTKEKYHVKTENNRKRQIQKNIDPAYLPRNNING